MKKLCAVTWRNAEMNLKVDLSLPVSPRSNPDSTGVAAGVANSHTTMTCAKAIIHRLEEEGASLYVRENALYFRPSDLPQLPIMGAQWKTLLHYLTAQEVSDDTVGKRAGRKFGFGRQLSYAGPQALKDLFGNGHYASVKAHSDRWQAFVRWCLSEQGPRLNDSRQTDRQVLMCYAEHVRAHSDQGEIGIGTVANEAAIAPWTDAVFRRER